MKIHESFYKNTLEKLIQTIKAVELHQVIDIKPEKTECRESCPCSGHGGAILMLNNGTSMTIPCTTVEIGALMWYFKCDNAHFTKYINESFEIYLHKNIAG